MVWQSPAAQHQVECSFARRRYETCKLCSARPVNDFGSGHAPPCVPPGQTSPREETQPAETIASSSQSRSAATRRGFVTCARVEHGRTVARLDTLGVHWIGQAGMPRSGGFPRSSFAVEWRPRPVDRRGQLPSRSSRACRYPVGSPQRGPRPRLAVWTGPKMPARVELPQPGGGSR
jgi:hypothetical protein